MGDQDTLASFLRYGQENRPAQSYALILWDHGGGPLEGVCWDETSGMDHLSLREVTGALDGTAEGVVLAVLVLCVLCRGNDDICFTSVLIDLLLLLFGAFAGTWQRKRGRIKRRGKR